MTKNRRRTILTLAVVLGVIVAFSGSSQAVLVVYEPFDYRSDGYTEFGCDGGYGVTGGWSRGGSTGATDLDFRPGGLSLPGSLVTGNSLYRPGGATGQARANRSLSSNSRTALLADNTTIWFSVLISSAAASNGSFVFGSQNFGTGAAPALAAAGSGFGFTKRTAAGTASTYINALAFVNSTAATVANGTFDAGTGVTRMIVGKINWKPVGTPDQLFLFNVSDTAAPEPAEGSAIATITADLNQSALDRVGVYDDGSMTFDEIRLGRTYLDVTGRDSDGDGMTDSFELQYTSPPSATALAPGDDLEPDGMTNLEEYQNMADPTKPGAQFVYYDFSNSSNRAQSNTSGGGKNLQITYAGGFNTAVTYSPMDVNGVSKTVMFAPNSLIESQYCRWVHNFPPNAGLGMVNKYTYITDMRWPPSENNHWRVTYGTYWEMAAVDTNNRLTIFVVNPACWADWYAPDPIPGQDHPGGNIQADTWYRIVYVVDLTKGVDSVVTYLNGVRAASADTSDVLNHYYFAGYCDTFYYYSYYNNEIGDAYLAGAQIRNYAVTPEEAAALGSATGAGIPAPTTSSAPLNLTAVSYGPDAVRLIWVDNSRNELGFKIERKEGTTGTYTTIALTGSNATDYIDMALTIGTQYFYRVRAYNSLGAGGYSNEVSFTPAVSLGTRQWSLYK